MGKTMSEAKSVPESLTPKQAWQMSQDDARTVLIDIRSTMEYLFVGHLPGLLWCQTLGLVLRFRHGFFHQFGLTPFARR